MSLAHIVRAAIHPAIGVARVGNSHEPGAAGYFVGPEVPEEPALPRGDYKDSKGALKRQAARFRIYGYDAAGKIVAELTPDNSEIEWTVHLANKKADWYEFQHALDIPEATLPSAAVTHRRNPQVTGADRSKLVIDAGPRSIRGKSTEGKTYQFDGGKFFDLPVPLGELRTDSAGHLLVLGGFGLSQSIANLPPVTFANNDGWHDDISDGPVDAKVKVDGREIPVDGAWVAVAPPNYAPSLKTVRTMWDLMYDLALKWKWLPAPGQPSFAQDILPIFERLTGLQWVNSGFASLFGAGTPYDAASLQARLADPSAENRQFRQLVYAQFRNPGQDHLGRYFWPAFYGDGLDTMADAAPPAGTDDTSLSVADGLAALSPTQLSILSAWVEGHFSADLHTPHKEPKRLNEADLQDQPHLLDKAALDFCLADAFHPGCEITWVIRTRSLYAKPFRIRRRPPQLPEADYGNILTPAVALGDNGPLSMLTPGDLTRWMAVPWQTDTASCLSGYSFFNISEKLPTFWPARVPNQVLREVDYAKVIDPKLPAEQRLEAFRARYDWFRVFDARRDKGNDITQMITDFDKLGIVEERQGVTGIDGIPEKIWVESEPELPEAEPQLLKAAAAEEAPTAKKAPARYHLRKFGKGSRPL